MFVKISNRYLRSDYPQKMLNQLSDFPDCQPDIMECSFISNTTFSLVSSSKEECFFLGKYLHDLTHEIDFRFNSSLIVKFNIVLDKFHEKNLHLPFSFSLGWLNDEYYNFKLLLFQTWTNKVTGKILK